MNDIEQDNDYIELVSSILYNDKFNVIKNIEHHGITRYEHSIKVSYYAYKIAKLLKLDYESVARAGLLHDYFVTDANAKFKDRFKSTFLHPRISLKMASINFDVNNLEADIISSHMFPFGSTIPKYAESWLVNFIDKIIGSCEFLKKFCYKFSYLTNLFLLFIIGK